MNGHVCMLLRNAVQWAPVCFCKCTKPAMCTVQQSPFLLQNEAHLGCNTSLTGTSGIVHAIQLVFLHCIDMCCLAWSRSHTAKTVLCPSGSKTCIKAQLSILWFNITNSRLPSASKWVLPLHTQPAMHCSRPCWVQSVTRSCASAQGPDPRYPPQGWWWV